jgi:NADPH-dependent ferric siderophore reductase
MPDSVPAAAAAQLDDPFAELRGPLAGTVRMRLEVVGNTQLTPHMQRLVLSAPELAEDGNRPVRRRYTIRDLDTARQLLTLDIVRHGDGPGERWVRSAQPGDTIEGIAPRGKIFLDSEADWYLFAADESGLAAVFAMTGSLPPEGRATAVLEVPEAADEQKPDLPAGVSLAWLPRDGRPAGDPEALAAALQGAELPPGTGHVYLFGEAKVVLALREVLAARGVPAEQVSAKAYWGRGKANAQHGEPAREG